MPRQESDALLAEGGLDPGAFIVKQRNEANTFELAFVGPNKRISHHMVSKSQHADALCITLASGKSEVVEDSRTVNDVVAALSMPHAVWPLPLRMFVPAGRHLGDKPPVKVPYRKRARRSSGGVVGVVSVCTHVASMLRYYCVLVCVVYVLCMCCVCVWTMSSIWRFACQHFTPSSMCHSNFAMIIIKSSDL